ncbi:MAG: TlpA family protein disulfide reductase [Planctomycetota bacterium]
MNRYRIALLLLPAVWLAVAAAAAEPDPSNAVPQSVFKEINALLVAPSEGDSPEERVEAFKAQLHNALQVAAEAEMKYPRAENLYLLRERMLLIADVLQIELQDPTAQKTKNAVARRIVESDAPVESKYAADQIILLDKLDSLPAGQIRAELLKFVFRYTGTDQEVPAKLYILAVAQKHSQDHLYKNLLDNLQANHNQDPGVRAILRQTGRGQDIGKPFDITLRKIDGTSLNLPEDLAGKVIVIDFWATWVPDAAGFAMQLKKIRKTFPEEKVAIVGINLDKASHRDRVQQFIKTHELNWIQTFSGRYTRDPAARQFSLFAPDAKILTLVPSHWVVGADGKIIADEAIATAADPDRLERTIRKALKQAESNQAGDKP